MNISSPYRELETVPEPQSTPSPRPAVKLPTQRTLAFFVALTAVAVRAHIAGFGWGYDPFCAAGALPWLAVGIAVIWTATLWGRWTSLRKESGFERFGSRFGLWVRQVFPEWILVAMGALAVVLIPWTDLTVRSLAMAASLFGTVVSVPLLYGFSWAMRPQRRRVDVSSAATTNPPDSAPSASSEPNLVDSVERAGGVRFGE